MADTNITLAGDYGPAAKELVNRIADGFGGFFKPWQTKRMATAEAEAEKLRLLASIERETIQERALRRFVAEESQHQLNMEAVARQALPHIQEGKAKPDRIDEDWLAQFLKNCRHVSNQEIQELWARILAGEANSPGSFSKRTMSHLSAFDSEDARQFALLCRLNWRVQDELIPIIVYRNADDLAYAPMRLGYGLLSHLASIGLVVLCEEERGRLFADGEFTADYLGTTLTLEHRQVTQAAFPTLRNCLPTGYCSLTAAGQELATICDSEPMPGNLDLVLRYWRMRAIVPKEQSAASSAGPG